MAGKPRHGMYESVEYQAWRHMKDRCHNPKSQRFDRYGGRGIVVCEEWRRSFEAFFSCVGNRPSPNHSIERLDNDGNYEPGNVVWATRDQQNANKSTSRIIEYDGRRMTLAQWASQLGIGTKTLSHRIDVAGMTVSEAFTKPIESRPWNNGIKGQSRVRKKSNTA